MKLDLESRMASVVLKKAGNYNRVSKRTLVIVIVIAIVMVVVIVMVIVKAGNYNRVVSKRTWSMRHFVLDDDRASPFTVTVAVTLVLVLVLVLELVLVLGLVLFLLLLILILILILLLLSPGHPLPLLPHRRRRRASTHKGNATTIGDIKISIITIYYRIGGDGEPARSEVMLLLFVLLLV